MAKQFTGIYQIHSLCKPERFYIGSSIDIESRFKRHLGQLRAGKHGNKFMQRHFDKFGEDDLVFEILMICDADKLLTQEQIFIDSLRPSFNMLPTAGSRLGFIVPFATREKIKASWKFRKPLQPVSRLLKKK